VRYDYIKSVETENYLLQAEQYKQQNDDQGYIRSLENAARFSSEIMDIKIKIADFYYEKGDYEKSSNYYEEIQVKLPYREDILYKLADGYEKMEKYDAALVVYQKLSNLKPGDIDISNKVNDLKIKFYDMNLPVKFKNIFFKYYINREDLAAFIGHYFEKYLNLETTPVIVTDIGGSFAKEYIIKLCTLNIMKIRPDHSFKRFVDMTRASFAVVMNSLLFYLKKAGYFIHITPVDQGIEPSDISPLHKHYNIIKFLVNSQIMKLDSENRFNPIMKVSPNEALVSIRKILNSID
jgi:tetratricopeptide (TPR) repeat protein